jgi:HAD superfamily hydrolase (TIGR01548 family)
LTPGSIGHGRTGDLQNWHAAVGGEHYPAPSLPPNTYSAPLSGSLSTQTLHSSTYPMAPPAAGVSADEVASLLAGIDQVEARVAALEAKKRGSSSSGRPFALSIAPGAKGRYSVSITAQSSSYPEPTSVLKKLGPIKALLWDMDGVLADVSQSYRTAIIQAAKKFGVTVTGADINAAKAAGNANNDWVLTRKLVAEKMAAQGKPASQVPSLESVTEAFEAVYQGGLWKTESLLVDRGMIAGLAARYPMAIVTGRPRKPDAERFLEHYKLTEFFSHMVCMGETPKPKPDPAPCNVMLTALGVTGGSNVLMIGDTVDDIVSAVGAKCSGVGVPAPGHDVAEDTELFHSVGATTVLSQGLPELKVLLEGPALATAPAPSGRYPWTVQIAAKAGAKRPWTVRIVPSAGGAGRGGGGSDADRLAALLAGIDECEQRLKNIEKNPPKKQAPRGAGGAAAPAASGATSSSPSTSSSPDGFFPTDMHWLRFGGQAGAAGFTTDATYTPPAAAPAPAPEPAAAAEPKKQAKQAKQKAPKEKQEKKKAKVWTDEEKAAARAKASGGGGNDAKAEAKKAREAKKAAAKAANAAAPAPAPEAAAEKEEAPAAEPAAPSGADTVSHVAGYYYAGYGIWALRPGAAPSVPSAASVSRPAVPELPLRDGRGGPKAEPAASANEYVAVETQGKGGGGAAPAPAPQKQKQKQKQKAKEQPKKEEKAAVGETVVEMSDADMLAQMRSAPAPQPETKEALSAAAKGLFAAAGAGAGAASSDPEWVMVDKEGEGEKTSPLPMLEPFKSECLTIICKFITDRGHKVPEVSETNATRAQPANPGPITRDEEPARRAIVSH